MKLLQLLPIGKVDDGLLKDLRPAVEETFRVSCKVLPVRLDPEFAFHRERQQYHSSEILHHMQSFVTEDSWRVLGIAAVDLYIPILPSFSARHRWVAPAPWFQCTGCARSSTAFRPTQNYFASARSRKRSMNWATL